MGTLIKNKVWTDFLHAIEQRLNQQSFETWFRSIRFDGCDDANRTFCLRVPNQVVKDCLVNML